MVSTIIAHVTEITVAIAFLLACLNAASQEDGRRWLFTVLWGAVAGFTLEALLVHRVGGYYYEYCRFWVSPLEIPLFIGLGWGTIFYIATWTAERLRLRSIAETAFVAGILAVNLDLSLDPTAIMNGFWHWRNVSFANCFFGVPFDNFVSWVAIIAIYSGFTNKVFALLGKRRSLFRDVIVPLIGALLAMGVFALLRPLVPHLYHCIGQLLSSYTDGPGGDTTIADSLGQAVIFGGLFLPGMFICWRNVFRAARDQPVNWSVLGLAVYFHVFSAILFVTGAVAMRAAPVTFTPIAVFIPINAILGWLAFAWPCIDELFRAAKKDQARVLFNEEPLSSYSGNTVRTLVARPTSEQEICAVLGYAQKGNLKVTFRGGGHAFDTQSLNEGMVVLLGGMKKITLAEDEETVTVECGATWGEILEKTLPKGRVPHVMITTDTASAAGTLSANSLSRFSPAWGREGKHVVSFRLVTPAGEVLTCSRAENADVFGAAIGGLGYVGAVVSCTYRLRQVDPNARVRSVFKVSTGIPSVTKAIREHAIVLAKELKTEKKIKKLESGDDEEALSAAMYLRGGIRGLVARSTYVSGHTPLKRSVFHSPRSASHLLLQLCAMIPVLRHLGFFWTYNVMFGRKKERTYVDEAYGYSFFEDGNVRIRKFLQLFGLPVPILQQTFIMPDEGDDETNLKAFFDAAAKIFLALDVEPALVDMLYLPADEDDFLLSSSHQMKGFAITFTFESLFSPLTKPRGALQDLSKACGDLGGRVHLVKNVSASRETIQKMYADRIVAMKSVRNRVGGTNVHNDFAGRIGL